MWGPTLLYCYAATLLYCCISCILFMYFGSGMMYETSMTLTHIEGLKGTPRAKETLQNIS